MYLPSLKEFDEGVKALELIHRQSLDAEEHMQSPVHDVPSGDAGRPGDHNQHDRYTNNLNRTSEGLRRAHYRNMEKIMRGGANAPRPVASLIWVYPKRALGYLWVSDGDKKRTIEKHHGPPVHEGPPCSDNSQPAWQSVLAETGDDDRSTGTKKTKQGKKRKRGKKRKHTTVQSDPPLHTTGQSGPVGYRNNGHKRMSKRYSTEQSDFLIYLVDDMKKKWVCIAPMFNEKFTIRPDTLGSLQSLYYRTKENVPLCAKDGLLVYKTSTDLEPQRASLKSYRVLQDLDAPEPARGLLMQYPERAMGYSWVSEADRGYAKDLADRRRRQYDEQCRRRIGPTSVQPSLHSPPEAASEAPVSDINHPKQQRMRGLSYTQEERDFIFYSYRDKGMRWEDIFASFVEMFGGDRKRTLRGLKNACYRVQQNIPVCDDDGWLVFENDTDLEPQYTVVGDDGSVRGAGSMRVTLVMCFPERARNYDWVDDSLRDLAKSLADMREWQYSEQRKRNDDFNAENLRPRAHKHLTCGNISMSTWQFVFTDIVDVDMSGKVSRRNYSTVQRDFILYAFADKQESIMGTLTRFHQYFGGNPTRTVNGMYYVLRTENQKMPTWDDDGRLVYETDTSLEPIYRDLAHSYIWSNQEKLDSMGLIQRYPERAILYEWVDDAHLEEAKRLVRIRKQQYDEQRQRCYEEEAS